MKKRLISFTVGLVIAGLVGAALPAIAQIDDGKGDPKKVWLCHFEENHVIPTPYGWDYNGSSLPGIYTNTGSIPPIEGGGSYPVAPGDEYLVGDYMVRFNATPYAGVPAGLNSGQINLCTRNGGEFIMVAVNALGSTEDLRGHRAQNKGALETYPDGWPNK